MTLKIEPRAGGVKVQRGLFRSVVLDMNEARLVADAAGISQEWPDGFTERLRDACDALLALDRMLANTGAPAKVLGETGALLNRFGDLVSEFVIYRPEVRSDQSN